MTRETKLGLIVGTSFLSLVGVVAYHTWIKGGEVTPPPDVPQPGIAAIGQNLKQDQSNASGVLPANFSNLDQQHSKGDSQGGVKAPLPLDQLAQPLNMGQPGGVPPAPLQASNVVPPLQQQTGIPSGPVGDIQLPMPPNSPLNGGQPAALGNAGLHAPANNSPHTSPINAGPAALNNAQAPSTAAVVNPQPGFPGAPSAANGPIGGLPGMPNPAAAGLDGGLNTPPVGNPIPQAPLKIELSPDPTKPPENPAASAVKPGNPGARTIQPVPPPFMPSDPKVAPPGPLTIAPGGKTPDTKDIRISPEPVPQIGTQGGITSPVIPLPAVPPGQGLPTAKPQVDSFLEREYICTDADIDFAALSRKWFNDSDKYAQALIEFNRDHPIGRDAVRDAPRLRRGAKVYIPPLHVLESRHSNVIPNFRPLQVDTPRFPEPAPDSQPKTMVPVTNGPATGSVVPVQPPGRIEPVAQLEKAPRPPSPAPVPPPSTASWGSQPSQPIQPVQGVVPPKGSDNVVPAAVPSNTGFVGGANKMYWVPQGGQPLWQIARETLGDASRWSEIWRLNEQYRPEEPIPGGTQLRLPADARVGQR